MILVEGIRCDVFQCLSYRWKRRKDIERMAKKNTYDAGSIAILEGLEAVRKRPGMYIGSVSTKGLNHLIYEIVDNTLCEYDLDKLHLDNEDNLLGKFITAGTQLICLGLRSPGLCIQFYYLIHKWKLMILKFLFDVFFYNIRIFS